MSHCVNRESLIITQTTCPKNVENRLIQNFSLKVSDFQKIIQYFTEYKGALEENRTIPTGTSLSQNHGQMSAPFFKIIFQQQITKIVFMYATFFPGTWLLMDSNINELSLHKSNLLIRRPAFHEMKTVTITLHLQIYFSKSCKKLSTPSYLKKWIRQECILVLHLWISKTRTNFPTSPL